MHLYIRSSCGSFLRLCFSSIQRKLPAFHILFKFCCIGFFQFLTANPIAKKDIVVIHQDIRHFFDEMSSQIVFFQCFTFSIFLNNIYNLSPYIFVYNCQRERIIVPFRRTDDQAIPRMWIKSASDTVYLCSFQKNGYASGHVLRCGPCFPQLSVAANLSYPAGFSDKRRPQFLRSASPQMGAAAAPIRGHASRCNSNAANRLRFPDSVFFLLFSIFTDGRLPE